MIKQDLNDTKYNYTLLPLIRLIKLYIESKVQQTAAAEYSDKYCTIKIGYAANAAKLKKLAKFTCSTIDMGTKYSQKQPMFSKVGC